MVKRAEHAGFLVFDLYELWKGRDQKSLCINSADNHPNAAGMRIIAERVLELIQEHHVELRIDMETAPPRAASNKEASP